MSWSITLKIINDSGDTLKIVEKTCQIGSTWTDNNGDQYLAMTSSGTSGVLRFEAGNGERFIVAAGVHSYKRWSSILVDLDDNRTAMKVHPTYYEGGPDKPDQHEQITKVTAKGR